MADLPRVIADAVARVVAHWNDMGLRIERYKATYVSSAQAENLLVKLVDCKAIPARDLYTNIMEFRKPRHVEFEGEHLWNLYNAVTENLKGGDLSKLPFRTMTMQSIFDKLAHHVPELELQEIVTKGCEDNAPEGEVDLRD